MDYYLPFSPLPLLKNPFVQTVFSAFIKFTHKIPYKVKHIELGDGDKIAVEISTPKNWKSHDLTVLLIHGLCGCSKSPYVVRNGKTLYKKGINVVKINLRGCGLGKTLAKSFYNSGCSPDIYKVVKNIKTQFPESALVLMGFSLGANITLKLAGELGQKNDPLLSACFAISPPVDLFASANLFCKPENKIYERYFFKLLLKSITDLHKRHKIPLPPFPKNMTITDLDELYICKKAHFNSAKEYYTHSSSKKVICDIAIPTKILLALDDPLVCPYTLDKVKLPPNINIYKTELGGHMGYLGNPQKGQLYWLDELLLNWISECRRSFCS